MPLYEYECDIHKTIEVQQSMSDPPLMECPLCQKDNIHSPVKKLISISAFHLMGSGWAKDQYSK